MLISKKGISQLKYGSILTLHKIVITHNVGFWKKVSEDSDCISSKSLYCVDWKRSIKKASRSVAYLLRYSVSNIKLHWTERSVIQLLVLIEACPVRQTALGIIYPSGWFSKIIFFRDNFFVYLYITCISTTPALKVKRNTGKESNETYYTRINLSHYTPGWTEPLKYC